MRRRRESNRPATAVIPTNRRMEGSRTRRHDRCGPSGPGLDRSPVFDLAQGSTPIGMRRLPDDRSDRIVAMQLRAIVDVATVLPPGPGSDHRRAATGPPWWSGPGDKPGHRSATGRGRTPTRPASGGADRRRRPRPTSYLEGRDHGAPVGGARPPQPRPGRAE
jgi:hypothetical protein